MKRYISLREILQFLYIIALVNMIVSPVYSFGQTTDTLDSGKSVREKVMADIQSGLEKKTKLIDSTVARIDRKLDSIDRSIRETNSAKEKADKLLDRVQALEDKQKAMESNELNIFQANYQAAVVNLLYMDREIKPVLLFKTSEEFFELLSETTNPMSYQGYNDWYQKFHDYVEKNKKSSVTLNVFANMVDFSGTVASAIPLGGPVTVLFFSGLEEFINSLGKRKKELRDESEKMFELMSKLSQFAHDKSDVAHDWEIITKELSEMHNRYDTVLNQSLKTLGISQSEFNKKFNMESDAEKRYAYITEIRQKASEAVTKQKTEMPKDWKENIYFSQMDVQSLKMRFGQVTFRMHENMEEYNALLTHYLKDPVIGSKVDILSKKLNELKEVFDNAFNPLDYLNSASRMYKVI